MTDPVTGIGILDWLLALLANWGYLIVFAITISENLFVVGSFTPGETIVMGAAFVASRGQLSLAGVWLASVVGTLIGTNISYWLGWKGGRGAITKWGERFHLPMMRIEAAEEYFYKHGSKTVFLARFAAYVKNFVPMIAGASRMGLFWFELFSLLGAIAQTTLMCAIGYFLGANFDLALKIASQIGLVGFLVFVALIVAAVVGRRRYMASRVDELIAEEEAQEADEAGMEGVLDEPPLGGMDEYEPSSDRGALTPETVRELVRSSFWQRIEGGGATGSTNDDARELAAAGASEGTVVLATSQSGGRGRFERTWVSPEGGVYLSAIFRPPVPPTGLPPLPLVVGLGVARGLEQMGATPRLKWPNDVTVGGRKIAGILVESRIAGSGSFVIAGVGLNVFRPQTPDDATPQAAYLVDSCANSSLPVAAAALLDGIAEAYVRFVAMGFAALADEYRARCDTLNTRVSVSDAAGALVAEGEVADIDAEGRLLVCSRSGISAVSAGEVTLQVPRRG